MSNIYPGSPTNLFPTSGNGQVVVSFTPGSNGESPITNYQFSIDGGSTFTTFSPAVTVSPVIIRGLTNGTTYSIALRAINKKGFGTSSTTVTSTPMTIPGRPTIVSIIPGNAQAIINFTPGSTGGSMITNYEYSINGGAVFTPFSPPVTQSPVTITGLTNGVRYSFVLRAVNERGSGSSSLIISSTPSTTPSSPTNLLVNSGNGQAFISFTPGHNGGSRIINYQYSIDGGLTFTSFSPAVTGSHVTIRGLTNGTTYSIALKAVNIIGPGESSENVSVTPYTVPSAPTGLSIDSGNLQATLSFTAGYNGGSAITNYQYSLDGGLNFRSFFPPITESPVTIGGLTNGTTYSVTLRAMNERGIGAASAIVSSTPSTIPNVPKSLTATPGNEQLTISFDLEYNGGTPITNYEYSIDGGSFTALSPAFTTSPVIIGGLTNGTMYSIALKAVNANGSGPASDTVSAMPSTVPYAPTDLYVTNNNEEVVIAFTPGINGGLPITNYEYSIDGGETFAEFIPAITSSPVTIKGLVNSQTYSIVIRAINENGVGTASTVVSASPSTTPDQIYEILATDGNEQTTITFTQGFDGGSPITNYEYSLDNGTTFTAFSPAVTQSPVTITNLMNGVSYDVVIRAVNINGVGVNSEIIPIKPSTVPAQPTALSANYGDQYVEITFSEGFDGGSPIINYEYSIDNGQTFTEFSPPFRTSPLLIDGLTNGTLYTIVIRAINMNGSGGSSAAITATPSIVPESPEVTLVTPGDGQLLIVFTPGYDGGAPITNYVYSIDNGETYVEFSPPVTGSPITITGLTNGTRYFIGLRAVNINGSGNSVSISEIPSTIPEQPSALSATTGDQQLTISFTEGNNGGSAITNYEYSIDGGSTFTAFSPAVTASPVTITGLTNGITYSIALKAVNANGSGTASSTISSTPSTTPAAPTSLSAAPGNGQVILSFTAGSNGGSSITNYEYSIDGGTTFIAFSPADSTSPVTITGLTNGTTYSIALRAVNVNGSSTSSTTVSVTPIDIDGVFVTGHYTTALTAYGTNATTRTLSVSGGHDCFIVKYSRPGVVQWAARIASSSTDVGHGIANDVNGNVYVTGYSTGTTTASGTNATTIQVASSGQDAYIAKYNSSGVALWIFNITSTGVSAGFGVDTDNSGNVYVTGYIDDSSNAVRTFNGANSTTRTITVTDAAFVAKYNTNGEILWAVPITGGICMGLSISVDNFGNSYITGQYTASLTASGTDATTRTLAISGTHDCFIIKYDTNGVVQWAGRLSGGIQEIGRGIATDGNGNCYVTGNYDSTGTITASGSDATTRTISAASANDCFILKYNTTGVIQWALSISGANEQVGRSIASDINGNIYVSGYYSSTSAISITGNNSSSVTLPATIGSNDVMLVKYNTNGEVLWVTRIGGTGSDVGHGVTVDGSGNVYVTGEYGSATVTIYNSNGNSSGLTLAREGTSGTDCYVVQYTSSGNAVWAGRITGSTGAEIGYAISSV